MFAAPAPRSRVRLVTRGYPPAPPGVPRYMNSPRVIELPRRLEPVTRDTFLAATDTSSRAGLAQVITFAPRERRVQPGKRPVAPAAPTAAA